MKKIDITALDDKNAPVYTIGIAAKLVGTTVQTLRLYEKHGFVRPVREYRNRVFTRNDIRRLRCLRDLIHVRKFSIEAIKKLINYAPCWQITGCPEEIRLCCFGLENMSKDLFSLGQKTSTSPLPV